MVASLPRPSRWEILMVALAAMHGVLLYQFPAVPLIAVGVWWNSNTIAHNFIHRPFFRQREVNALFGAYLSVLLGVPQALWRDRHLAHHAGVRPRLRLSTDLFLQVALVLGLWIMIAAKAPRFFLFVYLPGYLAGLVLCALQGHYEHARGIISHYGALYNALFFNDGYHAEHHSNPAAHWTSLPHRVEREASVSAWPAALRWMEWFSLEGLERVALACPVLRRRVLHAHEGAFRVLADLLPEVRTVGIVGGGLFPRTALILRRLLPEARLSIIDANAANLEQARRLLGDGHGKIDFIHAHYPQPERDPYDLLVIPLCFIGDRAAIYKNPPARAVIVHDWIWRSRGASRIVSIYLLKRINLVVRT